MTGGAYGGYRCGALAGTREIAGLGEWLPDQQPRLANSLYRRRQRFSGGISSISPRRAVRKAMLKYARFCPVDGPVLRLTGNSAMPPSMRAPNPSIIRTTLPSRSVITAGVWGWRRVSRNMTPTNKSWLRCRTLRCRPSPSRAVTTEHHILHPPPMRGNSPENMSTVLSAQRLATTRRRKIRRTLLTPLSTRISSDMCYFQSVTS